MLGTGQGGGYNVAMFTSKARARWVLWMACCAILLAALAPTLSRALTVARGGSVPSLEICSVAGGMNMVPVKLSIKLSIDDSTPAKNAMQMGDCPCCGMHAAVLALPPLSLAPATGAVITGLLPVLFYQSATPLFAWTAFQPRGPPASF